MPGRGVFFDLDGTLVDSEPVHFRALRDILEEHGYEPPEGFADKITGLGLAECHALMGRMTGFVMPFDHFESAKCSAYLKRTPDLTMRSGALDAFKLVEDLGARTGIVSNSDRIIVDANLGATGLTRPGLITVTRNDVLDGKPSPEPYLRAAHLCGVDPQDCIVVEDSPIGAAAGLAAGMRVVAWPEPHRSDLTFPDGVHRLSDGALAPGLRRFLETQADQFAQ